LPTPQWSAWLHLAGVAGFGMLSAFLAAGGDRRGGRTVRAVAAATGGPARLRPDRGELDGGVPDVEVRPSPVAGRGLFATAAIPAGTEVLRPEAPVHEQGPVNHACDPNLGWVGDALVTLRDVAAGEELLVDYAMSSTDPAYLLRCHCESYRCRQMVEGTDWRIPQLQLRYAGHWAPKVQALITNSQA
jgi:hypothetical protein